MEPIYNNCLLQLNVDWLRFFQEANVDNENNTIFDAKLDRILEYLERIDNAFETLAKEVADEKLQGFSISPDDMNQ